VIAVRRTAFWLKKFYDNVENIVFTAFNLISDYFKFYTEKGHKLYLNVIPIRASLVYFEN